MPPPPPPPWITVRGVPSLGGGGGGDGTGPPQVGTYTGEGVTDAVSPSPGGQTAISVAVLDRNIHPAADEGGMDRAARLPSTTFGLVYRRGGGCFLRRGCNIPRSHGASHQPGPMHAPAFCSLLRVPVIGSSGCDQRFQEGAHRVEIPPQMLSCGQVWRPAQRGELYGIYLAASPADGPKPHFGWSKGQKQWPA